MLWQSSTGYEFGPFRVDPRERQLMRDGQVVPLRPKVFDILLMLVQNRGHILSKDDLMKHVWSNTVVEEGNISRNISTLRNVLGEGPREHNYIETIPWRGYRFVANVKEVWIDEQSKAIESIAVLPFVNVSADPKIEYLVDGITDGLINSLATLPKLRVTSRNSAFRYKGRDVDVQTVGRELKVQALLMGRVSQSEDLLSINVELIDTTDDRHLWGGHYIRKPSDLVTTLEVITRKLREKLRQQESIRQQYLLASQTNNPEAHVLYLKGRYYFNKLTPDGVQRAITHLDEAIEKDPTYALAYTALGDCHNYMARRDEAKAAVVRALQLDDTLGEAHASLGFFRFLYDWDFAGAESSFKNALALNPNYAEAHHWYGIYLANLGRHEEAEGEAKCAVELDPLSLLMNMTAALNFYLARENDSAMAQLRRVLEMEPNFVPARSVMGNVLVQKGRYEDAAREFQKVLELIEGVPSVDVSIKSFMAHAAARTGKRSDALKLLEEINRADIASPYSIAAIHAALNDCDAAFKCLDEAYAKHDVQLVSLKVDPSLDGIRADPRFHALVRRVGLP